MNQLRKRFLWAERIFSLKNISSIKITQETCAKHDKYMKICFERRETYFQCFFKLLADIKMFWQHYQKNKIANFPRLLSGTFFCCHYGVLTTIFRRIINAFYAEPVKFPWHGFCQYTTPIQAKRNKAAYLSTTDHVNPEQRRKGTINYTEIVINYGLTQLTVCLIVRFISNFPLNLHIQF